MRSTTHTIGRLTTILILTTTLTASAEDVTTLPISDGQVVYQMIGEFTNSGTANAQYGYLSSVAGLSNAFSSTSLKDESTALFTFVTNATTTQVVTHGAFRIINRTGTTMIYLNSGPSSFDDPASFSQGTPIQVSSFTQQVILNITPGSFTTVHTNVVSSVHTFKLGARSYRLGQVGKSFRTNYSGQTNTTGTIPNGWFGGTSTGIKN